MLNGGQAATSAIQMKNLEKKCADLEAECNILMINPVILMASFVTAR